MRRAFFVVIPLFLAGCGLPPLVTVASYALDGISFISTGKTVSDHALSAVAQKDCALFRLVKNELVCRKYRDGERGLLVAFADQWRQSVPDINSDVVDAEDGLETVVWAAAPTAGMPADEIAAADPMVVPGVLSDLMAGLEGVATVAPASQADAASFSGKSRSALFEPHVAASIAAEQPNRLDLPVQEASYWKPVITIGQQTVADAAPKKPSPRAGLPAASTVLIVGSFRTKINARRAAEALKSFRPVVVPVRVAGKTYFRVVTGPFPPTAVKRRKGALEANGVRNAWLANLCRPGRKIPGCVSLSGGTQVSE